MHGAGRSDLATVGISKLSRQTQASRRAFLPFLLRSCCTATIIRRRGGWPDRFVPDIEFDIIAIRQTLIPCPRSSLRTQSTTSRSFRPQNQTSPIGASILPAAAKEQKRYCRYVANQHERGEVDQDERDDAAIDRGQWLVEDRLRCEEVESEGRHVHSDREIDCHDDT